MDSYVDCILDFRSEASAYSLTHRFEYEPNDVLDGLQLEGLNAPFHLPFGDDELAHLLDAEKWIHRRPGGRVKLSPEDAGERMWRSLFGETARPTKLGRDLERVREAGYPVRLVLRFQSRIQDAAQAGEDGGASGDREVAEHAKSALDRLRRLPWELLRIPQGRGQFLAFHRSFSVVRQLHHGGFRVEPVDLEPDESLRILILAANPEGTQQLDLTGEIEHIREAVASDHLIRVDVRSHATLTDLHEGLLARPHVLHFLGHGESSATGDEAYLVLEAEEGEGAERPRAVLPLANAPVAGAPKRALAHHLSAIQLADEIQQAGAADSLRVIVLNACRTTAQAAGLAPELLAATRVGVLIGTAATIPDRVAIEMASSLYRRFAQGLSLEEAVASTRLLLSRHRFRRYGVAWALPNVFYQLRGSAPPFRRSASPNEERRASLSTVALVWLGAAAVAALLYGLARLAACHWWPDSYVARWAGMALCWGWLKEILSGGMILGALGALAARAPRLALAWEDRQRRAVSRCATVVLLMMLGALTAVLSLRQAEFPRVHLESLAADAGPDLKDHARILRHVLANTPGVRLIGQSCAPCSQQLSLRNRNDRIELALSDHVVSSSIASKGVPDALPELFRLLDVRFELANTSPTRTELDSLVAEVDELIRRKNQGEAPQWRDTERRLAALGHAGDCRRSADRRRAIAWRQVLLEAFGESEDSRDVAVYLMACSKNWREESRVAEAELESGDYEKAADRFRQAFRTAAGAGDLFPRGLELHYVALAAGASAETDETLKRDRWEDLMRDLTLDSDATVQAGLWSALTASDRALVRANLLVRRAQLLRYPQFPPSSEIGGGRSADHDIEEALQLFRQSLAQYQHELQKDVSEWRAEREYWKGTGDVLRDLASLLSGGVDAPTIPNLTPPLFHERFQLVPELLALRVLPDDARGRQCDAVRLYLPWNLLDPEEDRGNRLATLWRECEEEA